MNKKYGVGIIGCGWICEDKHIPAMMAQDRAGIVALCDIKPEKAERLVEKFQLKDVAIYCDYKEMMRDGRVDIVHVATPNPLHCEMAVTALEAGKHVLCEKPMACTKKEADQMIAAAQKANKKLTVGFNWRYRPEALYIKELCDKGSLGDIYYAKAHATRYRAVPVWGELITGNNGGGVLIDGAPHALDLVLWLMNNYEPLSVKANIYNNMIEQFEGNIWGVWKAEEFKVEDSGFALITMKNGATIMLEAAWLINMLYDDNKATLCGTKAGVDMLGKSNVRVNGVECGKPYIWEPDLKDPMAPFSLKTLSPSLREAKEWLDCIEQDKEPFIQPEQAAVVTQIIEGIYKSAKTGNEIFF